jgi:hypothetical protein
MYNLNCGTAFLSSAKAHRAKIDSAIDPRGTNSSQVLRVIGGSAKKTTKKEVPTKASADNQKCKKICVPNNKGPKASKKKV